MCYFWDIFITNPQLSIRSSEITKKINVNGCVSPANVHLLTCIWHFGLYVLRQIRPMNLSIYMNSWVGLQKRNITPSNLTYFISEIAPVFCWHGFSEQLSKTTLILMSEEYDLARTYACIFVSLFLVFSCRYTQQNHK